MTWSIHAYGTKAGALHALSQANYSGSDEVEKAMFEKVKDVFQTAIQNASVPGPDYYKRPVILVVKATANGHGASVSNIAFTTENVIDGPPAT